MVNVPGRSKGCNTCRRRKVACSLEKPYCQRCSRAKLACTGYERERVFVMDRWSAAVRVKQPSSASTNDQGPLETQNDSTGSTSCWPVIRLSQEVPASDVYQQQLLARFLDAYLPKVSRTGNNRPRSVDSIGRTWFHLLPSFITISPALRSSMLALCAAFVGRRHGDEVLLRESLVYHGQALWALQKALWDPRAMYQDDTLAACMLLLMYELTECPSQSNTGWISHMNGCARLVQQRGPAAHTSDAGHHLFSAFRITALMEAIVNGRPTYLSDPAWISTPWVGRLKPRVHQLLDITSAVAAEFAHARTLDPCDPRKLLHTASNIADRCWRLESSLRHFYAELEHETADPLYWDVPAVPIYRAAGLKIELITPAVSQFTDLLTGYNCVLYWSTALLLWIVLTQMYQILGVHLPSHYPPIKPSVDPSLLSRNICQAVPYFLQDSMGTLGPSLCVIPLVAIMEILRNVPGYESEVAWAQAVMQHVRGRGMRLMGEGEHDR